MSDEQANAVDRGDGGAEPSTDPDAAEGEPNDAEREPNDASSETGGAPIEEIAERVGDEDPDAVAEEIAALREEAAALERDRDDLESRLKRKQAEFQNYKKRQKKRREREQARATEDLVTDLLEVRDNLSRALEQDADADIREGVEATLRSLEDVLAGEGVEPIEPGSGTETDPERHEVLLRVESDEPEGTVADLHRPGYEMAEKVLRAAQVTVSDGSGAGDGGEGDGDGMDGADGSDGRGE
ncbi:DnaJ/DnaK ATPase stimulator GrpE [Natronomonas moolapensis 8.8.11]|uniref:Protein GrpE n=1 Tax=Natronomonas moolapensis (strain DSM 18674 / CECT 7526 / JCM 14361 / 8.8.11) TaxID=268739 RepID=M1XTD0_NATM8|nr:nucleotide exchange factor GrpE [Natronomonas moolapensis]CCQ37709.1 DnaJ/DnaK ATPase stimulator GrpE [Natronomonas moolapensis 8.8.11]